MRQKYIYFFQFRYPLKIWPTQYYYHSVNHPGVSTDAQSSLDHFVEVFLEGGLLGTVADHPRMSTYAPVNPRPFHQSNSR